MTRKFAGSPALRERRLFPAFSIAKGENPLFHHSVVKNRRSPALTQILVLILTLGVLAGGRVWGALWELDLSGREPGAAPEFGQDLEIREENGMRFLSKQDFETRFLFGNQMRPNETAAWNNLVFRVKYREQGTSTMSLVVKSRGLRANVPYMQYYISIRGDGIGVLCHGLAPDAEVDKSDPRVTQTVRFSSLGLPELSLGEWITVEARVGDEVVQLRVDGGDGVTREVELPVFPGSGGVSLLSRSPIDVAEVKVEEAGADVVPRAN